MGQGQGTIPTRQLGRTGLQVSIIGLGGYHVGTNKDIDQAAQMVREAIDQGINFLDNAHCYHDGYSEQVMGQALSQGGYRDRVILMTKNHGRDAGEFSRQLDDSLRNLKTDHLDLVQFHALSKLEEVDAIYAPGGAIEAALKAREQGKTRFIGFTGHYRPAVHRAMIERGFQWDTCQLPANLLDAQHLSFLQEVVPLLRQHNIGVIGMKSLANGQILKTGVTAAEAIRYSLSLPIDILISGIDSPEHLQENLKVARSFTPMPEDDQQALLDSLQTVAASGELEQYKQQGHG